MYSSSSSSSNNSKHCSISSSCSSRSSTMGVTPSPLPCCRLMNARRTAMMRGRISRTAWSATTCPSRSWTRTTMRTLTRFASSLSILSLGLSVSLSRTHTHFSLSPYLSLSPPSLFPCHSSPGCCSSCCRLIHPAHPPSSSTLLNHPPQSPRCRVPKYTTLIHS